MGKAMVGAVVAVVVMAGAAFAGCGDGDRDGPHVEDLDVAARRMVEEYFDALASKSIERIERVLAPSFVVARTDGSFASREEHLAALPDFAPDYEITELRAFRNRDVVVVGYLLRANVRFESGNTVGSEPARRLSTFQYDDGRWRMTSHANFGAQR